MKRAGELVEVECTNFEIWRGRLRAEGGIVDFVKPAKKYRAPTAAEREAMDELLAQLEALPADADAEAIQNEVYEVGKRHDFENLRAWFKTLYEVLLGQEQGPRMGSFMALYGLEESKALIRGALDKAAAE